MAIAALTASLLMAGATDAAASGGPVIIIDDGGGQIDTIIQKPGSPGAGSSGSGGGGSQPVAGGSSDGVPAVTCVIQDAYVFGGAPYQVRVCSDGTQTLYVPPLPGQGTVTVTVTTPVQLAQQARDSLLLPQPTAHRSPQESNSFRGTPFTWVGLWTWVWTNPGDYQPLRSTVSLAGVFATVVATPKALLFDPGDGSPPVSCEGPGQAWSESDGDDAPPAGCGYRYRHVTEGAVTSRVGIVWSITWTGTGGAGGTLPDMQTFTEGPLRVLQTQVVNR